MRRVNDGDRLCCHKCFSVHKISTIRSKGLAEGQQGDNKGPLLSHLYSPVFSAGQLQCNLTSAPGIFHQGTDTC